MKFATRIQPFVVVSRKEADAIEMDQKLSNILYNKQLNALTKSRLFEDGMARMNNFKQNNELGADVTEEAPVKVVPTRVKTRKKREDRQSKFVESSKDVETAVEPVSLSRHLNTAIEPSSFSRHDRSLSKKLEKEKFPGSKTVARKSKSTPREDGPVLFVDTAEITTEKADAKLPRYMQSIKNSRASTPTSQGGKGSIRLYVRNW